MPSTNAAYNTPCSIINNLASYLIPCYYSSMFYQKLGYHLTYQFKKRIQGNSTI